MLNANNFREEKFSKCFWPECCCLLCLLHLLPCPSLFSMLPNFIEFPGKDPIRSIDFLRHALMIGCRCPPEYDNSCSLLLTVSCTFICNWDIDIFSLVWLQSQKHKIFRTPNLHQSRKSKYEARGLYVSWQPTLMGRWLSYMENGKCRTSTIFTVLLCLL